MSAIAEYLLVDCLEDLGSYIVYYPCLVNITGSLGATVLLLKLIYWGKKTDDPDGVCKTEGEIAEATGMTATELRNARKLLREAGLTRESHKGVPMRLFILPDRNAINRRWMEFTQGKLRSKQEELREERAKKYIHSERFQGKFVGSRETSFPVSEELATTRVPALEVEVPSFPDSEKLACRNPESLPTGNREACLPDSEKHLYKQVLKQDLKKEDPPLPPKGEGAGAKDLERSRSGTAGNASGADQGSPIAKAKSSHVAKNGPPIAPPAAGGGKKPSSVAQSAYHPDVCQALWEIWLPMFRQRRGDRDDRRGFVQGFDLQIKQGADVAELEAATRFYVERQELAIEGSIRMRVPPDGIRFFKGSKEHPTPYWQDALAEMRESALESSAALEAALEDSLEDAPDTSKLQAKDWTEEDREFWLLQFERLGYSPDNLRKFAKKIGKTAQAKSWLLWAGFEYRVGRLPRYDPFEPYPIVLRQDGVICEQINGELVPQPEQPKFETRSIGNIGLSQHQVNVNALEKVSHVPVPTPRRGLNLPSLVGAGAPSSYAPSYSSSYSRSDSKSGSDDYDEAPF